MSHSDKAIALPPNVKRAAGLLVLYGAAALLNATAVHGAGGWRASPDIPWALARLIAALLIAWGLLQRARWAWWIAVAFSALWLMVGALSLLVLEHHDIYWLPPSGFQLLLVGSLAALGGCFGLLVSPSARRAFGGRGRPVVSDARAQGR